MNTYNPSSYSRRVYWITDPGKRLASYLDYCDSAPTLSPDITFADVPVPEQHDIDHQDPPKPEQPRNGDFIAQDDFDDDDGDTVDLDGEE